MKQVIGLGVGVVLGVAGITLPATAQHNLGASVELFHQGYYTAMVESGNAFTASIFGDKALRDGYLYCRMRASGLDSHDVRLQTVQSIREVVPVEQRGLAIAHIASSFTMASYYLCPEYPFELPSEQ